MASWIDLLSLLATTFFFLGSILGVLCVVKFISSCIQSMKTSLEQRGIAISPDGKTLKRLDRVVDATQRGSVRVHETHNHGMLRTSSAGTHARNEHEKHALGVPPRR